MPCEFRDAFWVWRAACAAATMRATALFLSACMETPGQSYCESVELSLCGVRLVEVVARPEMS